MNRLKISMIVLLILASPSCGDDDPINETANLQHGTITLTTDWSKIGEGITKPASYIIEIGGQKVTATADKCTLDYLFEAGTYRGYTYNMAEHISISDGLAKVDSVSGSSTTVEPTPGWFFSASNEVEIENDTHHEFTAVMQQQVRQLDIELTVTDGDIDNIETITASLSGVANTIDLKTGTCSGTGLKVEPVFTKSDNKLIGSVRLIGLAAEAQMLMLDISYKVGSPQQLITDMSSYLTDFSIDKHIPMTLTGNISITSGIGVEFDSEISGWENQGQVSVDTDEH